MRNRSLPNRRILVWLLSVAFLLMVTVSGASWQCLDGHPCPPGCTMQKSGGQLQPNGAPSPPSCCVSHGGSNAGKIHCALCAAARPTNSRIKARCTSPVCVLRMQAKPDSNLHAVHIPLIPDTTVVLLPSPVYVLVPEETGAVSFGSARAPPSIQAIARLFPPRGPPAQLL